MGDLERGDVEGAVQILNSHLESGEKNHGNISPSIWRVPSVFRGVSPTCFDPCLVSIGPLHSEDKDLQEHQAKKQTYLYDLLERIGSPSNQTVLQECVQKVNASIGRIRACYKDLNTTDISDNQLVAMMVLDGCFIIEFLLKRQHQVFQSAWFVFYISIDLILVENQIPFFVLEDIFSCTILKVQPSASLTRMLVHHLLHYLNPFDTTDLDTTDNIGAKLGRIFDFFHKCFVPSSLCESRDVSSVEDGLDPDNVGPKHLHILDFFHNRFVPSSLSVSGDRFPEDKGEEDGNVGAKHHRILNSLHKCFVPSSSSSESRDGSPGVSSVAELNRGINSAAELSRAGVKFEHINQGESWSMAMNFEPPSFMRFYWPWGRATLKMPFLNIQDNTAKILRNFIAYEQFSRQVKGYFIAYAIAMDVLIDDKEDIAVLMKSKVISNILGSNEDAVRMINSLGNGVYIDEFFYRKEWTELRGYCKAYWPKHIAWLRRTYFNNPWNVIALFGAVMLFILTAIQTFFTVKATK